MSLDFSFDDLAAEFSVDVTYLFSEFTDQLCEYDEDYNLDDFLTRNGFPVNGTAYGFGKDTGASDDISILTGSKENADKSHKATEKIVAEVESWDLFDNIDRNDSRWVDWVNWVLKELSEYNTGLEGVDRDTYAKIMKSVAPGSENRNFALNYPAVYLKAEEGDERARRFMSICSDTCEGGRYSCYIGADMIMVPCSFDQDKRYEVSLREMSITEAWNSEAFERFRDKMRGACLDCEKKELCMGGCPLMPEIVFCKNEKRKTL